MARQKMLILFNDSAPEEPRAYCVLHDGSGSLDAPRPGQTLLPGGAAYKIAAAGALALENLNALGHVTLCFDGEKQARYPHLRASEGSALRVASGRRIYYNKMKGRFLVQIEIFLLLLLAAALQTSLYCRQIKKINTLFFEMRRKGPVLVGRKKTAFRGGAVVVLRLSEDHVVREAYVVKGFTAFADIRPFESAVGKKAREISNEGKGVVREAFCDAADRYQKFGALDPSQSG